MGDAIVMRLLRILSGVFVILAVAVCAMTFYQGSSVSPDVAALLKKPSAVSTWQNHNATLTKSDKTSRVSPVVAQARIYARLLNPPKPAKPVARNGSASTRPKSKQTQVSAKPLSTPPARPRRVSPTFKVHATSVFSKHPEKSMALISQPGKRLSWIRPGDSLGDLKVIDIRKDAVVYAYEDTIGEVAWESSKMPASKRAELPDSAMVMDLPELSTDPVAPSLEPATPLPSRLAAPIPVRRMYSISPRRRRGAR
jgi:hypothetical protein